MKIKFTEKSIKSLEAKPTPYEAIDLTLPGFRLRVQPTGLKTFIYDYKDCTGRKERYTLGRHGVLTLSQAREKAIIAAGKVADGRSPQAEKRETTQKAKFDHGLTLQNFIEWHYRPWVLRNMKSGQNTLNIIQRHFSAWNNLPMISITPVQVERWQLAMQDKGTKPVTINRNLAALRSVYSKAQGLDLLDSNPLKRVKNVQEIKEDYNRFLEDDEKARLLAALDHRDAELRMRRDSGNIWREERGYSRRNSITNKEYPDHITPIVLIAMYTGLRKGEIFKLKWQDVDLGRKQISVRAVNAKSKKERYIPLHSTLVDLLTIWRAQRMQQFEWVFPNGNGKPFTDIKKAWQSVLRKAQIKNFRFHDLRHHFASQLVMKETPLNTVRELLGHADIGTTLRYAHLADYHKADVIGRLE